MLTNDIVSFEQPGPEIYLFFYISKLWYLRHLINNSLKTKQEIKQETSKIMTEQTIPICTCLRPCMWLLIKRNLCCLIIFSRKGLYSFYV